MSQVEEDLLKLLIALRDASAMIVEAVNAYLEAKAPPEVKFEKIADLFPKDLADLLVFEETPDAIIIKPRQYLGSETFARIAAIVEEHKGAYISQGRESHFRMPKKSAK